MSFQYDEKHFTYILIFFIFKFSFAQTEEIKNNAAYIELSGNAGSLVSGNYERLINYNKLSLIRNALRVGIGFSSNRWDESSMYNIPLELNTLIGKNKHFVEVGFGWSAFIGTSDLNSVLIPIDQRSNFNDAYFIRLGYRYMGEAIVVRAAPLLGYVKENIFSTKRNCLLGFGISFGGMFNFRKN